MSRICANLDEDVAALRDRPFADTTYTYVFLDATYLQSPRRPASDLSGGRRRCRGRRRREGEVLGFEVGETESQLFWTSFLRSLNAR